MTGAIGVINSAIVVNHRHSPPPTALVQSRPQKPCAGVPRRDRSVTRAILARGRGRRPGHPRDLQPRGPHLERHVDSDFRTLGDQHRWIADRSSAHAAVVVPWIPRRRPRGRHRRPEPLSAVPGPSALLDAGGGLGSTSTTPTEVQRGRSAAERTGMSNRCDRARLPHAVSRPHRQLPATTPRLGSAVRPARLPRSSAGRKEVEPQVPDASTTWSSWERLLCSAWPGLADGEATGACRHQAALVEVGMDGTSEGIRRQIYSLLWPLGHRPQAVTIAFASHDRTNLIRRRVRTGSRLHQSGRSQMPSFDITSRGRRQEGSRNAVDQASARSQPVRLQGYRLVARPRRRQAITLHSSTEDGSPRCSRCWRSSPGGASRVKALCP